MKKEGSLIPTKGLKLFVDVSTECSSRHQGKSDDDWSIQLKHCFQSYVGFREPSFSIYAGAN